MSVVNSACDAFRASIDAALAEPRDAVRLARLGSHAHAQACEACAAMLARATRLEGHLDLLDDDPAPAGLAARLLARLEPRRDLAALEPWLAALDDVDVPDGLAQRVLAGVEGARKRRTVRPAPRWVALAAAATLLVAGALAWRTWRAPSPAAPELEDARLVEAPSDELLAALDVLEEWDLVTGADGGADGGAALAVGALDELDLWMLELAAEAEPAPEQPAEPGRGTPRGERG